MLTSGNKVDILIDIWVWENCPKSYQPVVATVPRNRSKSKALAATKGRYPTRRHLSPEMMSNRVDTSENSHDPNKTNGKGANWKSESDSMNMG